MRLLILGTGGMANNHAEHFAAIDGVEIVGGVDISSEHLEKFCDKHKVLHRFSSLSDALAWGKFDAVANVTPDDSHHFTTMALIAAGKHVFCEKPLATDHAHAVEMTAAIETAGLVGMVNLSYRNVPHIHRARAMVAAGEIGSVKHVEASYLQSWLVSKTWGDWKSESQWLWRLSKSHGSNGVLGDVGIHILDFMSFGAAQDVANLDCRLQTFHKAKNDQIGEYRLDANDSFVMSAELANGALCVVHASRWATGHLNELRLRVYGSEGGIEVTHRHNGSDLKVCVGTDIDKAEWKSVEVQPVKTNYQKFAEAVETGRTVEPSFRRAADIQRLLDMCAQSNADGHRHAV